MDKKIWFIGLLGAFMLFFSACDNQAEVENIDSFEECVDAGYPVMESFPEQCIAEDETFVKEIDYQRQCTLNDGRWIEEAKECEGISEDMCISLGGEFDQCGSACRNQPEAQFCTKQCVPYCSFS